MVDHDRTSTDPHGTSHAQQAPGGGTSRGPDFGTGGEPQVPVMPYDDLRGAPGENTAPKAFDASNAPAPGPAPAVSDEERDGVTGTELKSGTGAGGRQEHVVGRRGEGARRPHEGPRRGPDPSQP